MPPIIPLAICTAFVMWLLRFERKQSPNVSLALWIPSLWVLLICSKPLGIWFGGYTLGTEAAQGMEAGSPLDRLFLLSLACAGLLIIITRKNISSTAVRNSVWAVILSLYMLISISWSEMVFVSFKRWIREAVAIIMIFCVATEIDPKDAALSIMRRVIYILIPYSLVLIKYYPHLGVIYARWSGMAMWTGATLHKNTLSSLCGFSIFFLVWTLVRRSHREDFPVIRYQKYLELFLLLLSIWLFLGADHSLNNSATSTVALALGFALLGILLWLKKRNKIISSWVLMLFTVIFIGYGTITPFAGELTGIDISGLVGREETLTGRADIWKVLVPYAMSSPLLGHGFGGFWTDAIRSITSSHAHNGYLDILLETGFLGLMLFSILFIMTAKNAQRAMATNFSWGTLWVCLLFMGLAQNITESSMVSVSSQKVAFLLLFNLSVNSIMSQTDAKYVYTRKYLISSWLK